ncbi:MAG TPA: urea carboxylase-associated family protein [Pyrinomonadaceae bacterium]|nr:urea carboxylase-associated family protein [Pyrinomonadaceae bacterium]
MKETVVSEFTVPARHGKAFVVRKGQVLSIIEIEGKQMADVVFLNANDYKEVFHAGWSAALNMMMGEGDMRKLKKLYSKSPRDNVMLTVVDDPTGVHLPWNGGRCSRKVYEEFFKMPGHRSCQDNLAEALAPYGLTEDDVPDVFNAFMNAKGFEEGRFDTLEPITEKGDYISMRAEMDVLVGVSACPFDLLYTPRPLGIKIVEYAE